jgi:hypothetical protein
MISAIGRSWHVWPMSICGRWRVCWGPYRWVRPPYSRSSPQRSQLWYETVSVLTAIAVLLRSRCRIYVPSARTANVVAAVAAGCGATSRVTRDSYEWPDMST